MIDNVIGITANYITNDDLMRHTEQAHRSFNLTNKIAVINKVNKEYKGRLRQINNYLITNSMNSQPRAWNLGIRKGLEMNFSKFFIGSNDIVLQPNTIKTLLEVMEETRAGIVSPIATNNLTTFFSHDPIDIQEKILNHDQSFAGFLIDFDTIMNVGYFDEMFSPAYFEDDDYLYRCNKLGVKCIKTHRAIMYHIGQDTLRNDQDYKRDYDHFLTENRKKYITKWGGVPSRETK